MMLFSEFKIDAADIDRFAAKLTVIDRQVLPNATRLALNDMAFAVFNANKDLMRKVFDAPTPFTLAAFWVHKATPTKLEAVIERKSFAARRHYLEVQQDGGRRGLTGIERLMRSNLKYDGVIEAVVPTAAMPRNAYGNVRPAAIQRILSGVQVQNDTAQRTTAASRKRAGSRRGTYFVPRPGSKLSPGVYERRGETLKKLLSFTTRRPVYEQRFPMEEEAAKNARAAAPAATERALKTAMQRLLAT